MMTIMKSMTFVNEHDKLKRYVLVSKFMNSLFRTRWQEIIYLSALSIVLSGLHALFFGGFWSLLWVLLIGSSILTLTTVRLSNACVYSRITKHISMIILDLQVYHNKDYVNNKSDISSRFQEEFIQALENAHKCGFRKIKMTTHAWLYHQVCLNERINSLYDVKVREAGTCRIPMEVLILASQSSVETSPSFLLKEALRTRKQYKIKLIRKRK
ncbi:hypothetical protein PP175_29690 (plasmid) [Aneurinibacillus sp. Ricciae_BoGa-3]|uniref:hypothetical protein n=1 Tax=Aneurinibacillus sp. Ricciae_BoGa-3 TaxID=3022697 RepID=UPI0023413366|nr:hypothetical protein [Aneurinibacillus sp. Ricciae_BoGa-3]WCK57365.1 hypothetical protein PP175_29690 [Aneurinibacillus sp. Ricciae_BoGa-3]